MDFLDQQIAPINYHLYNEDVALDVLLDMCAKKQVMIKDIFVSDITNQFIKYVETLETIDYGILSSFLVLAATLLEIKSSEMLPKIDFDDLEVDYISERELFLIRTEEYALLRNASQKLQELEVLHRYYREPEFDEKDFKVIIKNFDIEKMISAFSKLIEEIEFKDDPDIPKTISQERYTIADQMIFILQNIKGKKILFFSELYVNCYSKIDVINMFLAILELAKNQSIYIDCSNEEIQIGINTQIEDAYEALEDFIKDVEEYN